MYLCYYLAYGIPMVGRLRDTFDMLSNVVSRCTSNVKRSQEFEKTTVVK